MSQNVNIKRILIKGILLFIAAEFIFVSLHINPALWNVYASAEMKRARFPVSTHAPEDAAMDVGKLNVLFASHLVSLPKGKDELRVLFLGDSATWGFLLQPQQTLTGQINSLNLKCGTKKIVAYNLSYPDASATKDLMILNEAMQYQPDLIVWPVTLYTLMPKSRTDHWLITQNPEAFRSLDARFHFLPSSFPAVSPQDKFLSPQRAVFRSLRFQLFSIVPLATGSDQIQTTFDSVPKELNGNISFEGMQPPTVNPNQISIDLVKDFYQIAGKTPIILINEPIDIIKGQPNSGLQYNFYYPRWVYDQYRKILSDAVKQNNWKYLNLWNKFPDPYFTNTPLHLNAEGEALLAKIIAPSIKKACP